MHRPSIGFTSMALALAAGAAAAIKVDNAIGAAMDDLPFIPNTRSNKGRSWPRSRKLKKWRQNHQRKRCHGRWK